MRTSFAPLAVSLAVCLVALAASPASAQPRRPTTPPRAPAAAPPAAAPAATPATTPPTTPPAAPAADADADGDAPAAGPDVDALRQEYLALRDRLFRSRARAAAVAGTLYASRLRVVVGYASGRHHVVTRATIRLDGASVYDDAEGAIAAGPAPRFEGHVAPGRHLLTIRVEASAKDDERFTSATESTVVVQVPQGKDVVVTARAFDDGDVGYAWQRGEQGSYKLGLDVAIKTEARAASARTGRRGAADAARRARR